MILFFALLLGNGLFSQFGGDGEYDTTTYFQFNLDSGLSTWDIGDGTLLEVVL